MSFKENVVKSFQKVKSDMAILHKDHVQLKKSANEWILYLTRENTALKDKIEKLENRQPTNIVIND